MRIEPGTYEGRIEDYGTAVTSGGFDQVFIKFALENGEKISWFGGLATKAKTEGKTAPIEWTVKTLLDCGFSGMDVTDMSAGPEGKCLEIGKAMELVIADHEYNGTIKSQVNFINIPGSGGPGIKRSTKEDISSKLNVGALKAELLRQKKMRETGKPVEKLPL